MRYVDHVEKNDRTLGGAYIPHDVFYIAPFPAQPDGILYQMNRAGIVCCTPPDFQIGRHDAYAYHLIHCVISGRGTVTLGDQTYRLQRGQIFLLPAYEAHNYCSDPKDPMGLVWIEFCGGDSNRLVKASMDRSTLLDAQVHPERHTDLIVRVAGYSAFFNILSRQTQDDIIARTEQTI